MLKIAITLVHRYSDAKNKAQIDTVLGLVDRITDTHEEFNDKGEVIGAFDTYHYEFKNFGIPHEVRFYQIVPYGKVQPQNFFALDSYNVLYGPEFASVEKTYFDWGLKRGTDHGADVSIYVEDLSKLDFKNLIPKLQQVENKANPAEFLQETGAKIANIEYMKKGGLRNG